jgi:outer membrane lipoprotein-sorting protein
MNKFSIAAALTTLLFSTSAFADKLSLAQLSEYLNKMTTAQSSFHQINADGSRDTGDIYIQRPGRIRFEYDPPNSALVLAVSNTLSIFDPQGDGMPQNYPLDKTPLGLVLAKRVDLENARMVVGHHYDGNATILSVQDPDHPERGRMDFYFTGPEIDLRQWALFNESGERTLFVLDDLQLGGKLRSSLFNVSLEIMQRTQRD